MKVVDTENGEIVGQTEEKELALVDDKFRFLPTGLIVKDNPTFEEWEECGLLLAHIQKRVHWWIGDWLNYGERRWGEMYAQAMSESGFNYQTVANDRYVAGKIEFSRRRENLTFSHHVEVASLPPPEQDRWLDYAEEEELTTRQLRQEIKQAKEEERREREAEETAELEASLLPTDHEQCLYKDDWTQLWWADACNLFFVRDDSIDLIVTSPPYNIGVKQGNGRILWGGVRYSDYEDTRPEVEYQAWQVEALNEMWRVAKPGASLFYNHKIRNRDGAGIHPLSWILKSNWIFRQQIVWDRGSTHNHEMTYFWPHDELIFWLTKGVDGIYLSPEGAQMSTVWRFNFGTKTDHPAPFPEELASRCIRASSRENDLVLDPFGGSMTTCFVAKKLRRQSIGVDISKNYVVKYAHRCRQEILL